MSAFALASHQDTLAKIDADLRDLETVDSLLPNSTYPVLTLPTEIVIEIFVQYLPAYPACPPLVGDGSPTRLAQICAHWRSIAHDTPALWRAIQLSFTHKFDKEAALLSVATANTWLGRSHSLPLSIVFRCSPNSDSHAEIISNAAAALLDHCSRWQYATWRFPLRLDTTLRREIRDMPRLLDLHIYSESFSAELLLGHIDAPALRKLAGRLGDDTFYLKLFSEETWSNLTTLKLSDVPPYIAASILKNTASLVHCWLHFFFDDDPVADSTNLSLPHLETLILEGSWCWVVDELLGALVIPSIQRLAIQEAFLSERSVDPTESLLRLLRTFASKHKTPASSTLQKGSTSHPRPLLPPTPAASTSKSTCPDTDLPLLLALSLSRYRLWVDPEIRMDIERCTRVRSNDNFFPLSYILEPPSPLSTAEASEAAIAKALRAHAADTVDLRMSIPSAEQMYKRKAGSFEIRPRFWGNEEEEYPTTRKDWDARTVEVQDARCGVSIHPWTPTFLLGPSDFFQSNAGDLEYTRIQNIISPGSPSDDVSAEPPKLKSFALVTFKTVEDAESSVAALEASKTRGRTGRQRQDRRSPLWVPRAGLARTEDVGRNRGDFESVDDSRVNDEQPLSSSRSDIPHTPSPSYPPNCLVFILNLDPKQNVATHGVDSCHLRLTSSTYANVPVGHFTDNPMVQGAGDAVVKAELVTETREEVYWEGVPEKVRMQAMKRMSSGELGQEEEAKNGSIGRERKRGKRHSGDDTDRL
ncbi:hypothetical protein C8F01DRAFT_1360580 [Mycena amicta]|nr:hypothetical protein C8F01DRAFT_1360580 [Mycena amicta]